MREHQDPVLLAVPPGEKSLDELIGPKIGAPRPKYYDEGIRKAAIQELLPEVLEWIARDGGYVDSPEAVADELLRVLKNGNDATRACCELERYFHWGVDDALHDILCGYDGALCAVHDKAVRSWMQANDVVPKLPHGSMVVVMANVDWKKGPERTAGEITEIDTGRGHYTVCCPSLGHVKEGLGTHGFIFPFEKVEEWNPEVVEQAAKIMDRVQPILPIETTVKDAMRYSVPELAVPCSCAEDGDEPPCPDREASAPTPGHSPLGRFAILLLMAMGATVATFGIMWVLTYLLGG